MNRDTVKQLPYGIADFSTIQHDGMYYVDKTRFIPLLEAGSRFVVFIRPRRFGKTLWLSVLEHYYDIGFADRFAETFQHTYIGKHPTAERNSYLMLMFNLAMVNPDVRSVNESFEANGKAVIKHFLRHYKQFFDESTRSEILAHAKTEDQLREIFFFATDNDLNIYLLIDEYDNFANTILTTAGEQAYRELTHGAGFFRYFFNLLKGATSGRTAGLKRLFITGVSPITMDDVTSGFNIGDNLSLDRQWNELFGFREEDVLDMLTYYQETGVLKLEVSFCLDMLRTWANHYRFSTRAESQVFHPDMVLYFLRQVLKDGAVPEDMIDQNIRTDYGKLRHLVLVDRTLNGNFSILKQLIDDGETVSDVKISFPLERLLDRDNFTSLLFYLGLVSIADTREGSSVLRIPNRTVAHLLYGYLREAFAEVAIFRIDLFQFAGLLRGMAYRGAWQPVFDFLATAIREQTAVRDYLAGEKVIQGFLLAYLNVTEYYLTWTERELGQGFADFYLEPFLARFPDVRYGYLIELKYLPRQAFSPARLEEVVTAATTQIDQYANDVRLHRIKEHVTLKKLVLVYQGWELAYREEVGDVEGVNSSEK